MDEPDSGTSIIVDGVAETTCGQCQKAFAVAGIEPFSTATCPHCGNTEIVPARLGGFLLLNLIGTGGMGAAVYYAKDETLGRAVAIKVLPSELGRDAAQVAIVKREAQAAARLNSPHIAQIYSFGIDKGQPYIVMELVSGSSLDRLIDERDPPNQTLVMRLGLQIAEALQAANEGGLVHGDIKPENVLLDEHLQAKLVDFGIATLTNQAASDGVWGTPYYVSPERIRRQKLDARSDIYCLGATLYHVLTGHPPFEGETPIEVVKARLTDDPKPLREWRPDLHPEIEPVIARMLQREAGARYPTYASLLSDLRKLMAVLPPEPASLGHSGRQRAARVKLKSRRIASAPTGTLEEYKRKALGLSAPAGGDAETDEPELETDRPDRGPAIRRALLWLGALLLLVLVAGAAIWGGRAYLRARATATALRLEARALTDARAAATALGARVGGAASNSLRAVNDVWLDAARFSNTVIAALGAWPSPPATDGAQGGDDSLAALIARQQSDLAAVEAARAETASLLERLTEAAGQTQSATSLLDVATQMSGLSNLLARATDLAAAIATGAGTIAQRTVDADTVLRREARLRAETRQRAEAEAARLRAEAEQRQTEEALQAATATEQTRLAELRAAQLPALRANDFKRATQELRRRRFEFKTEAGRADFESLAERYERMEGLRAFLIERLAARPLSWAWIQGRSPEDVIGADDQVVRLRKSEVPWSEVSLRQFIKLTDAALSDRDVRASTLGEQALAAALYCVELAEGSEAALLKAREYRTQALARAPALRPAILRLLPEN